MQEKGLRVNMGKTKVMMSGIGLDVLKPSGKHPCGVCLKGVGNNSMLCHGCSKWVHKRCTGRDRVTDDPLFRCSRCLQTARPIDGRPAEEIQVGDEKIEVVAYFVYLGDTLSAGGGCEAAVRARVGSAWKKFRGLLPILTARCLSYGTRGRVYSTCVRSAMLHASETWPLTEADLQRLRRSDRAMIRWMCNVKPEDTAMVRSVALLNKLGVESIDVILREKRLRWYGHVERSTGAINSAYHMQVAGNAGRGRPKMTWKEVSSKDRAAWNLDGVDPSDRIVWRNAVRTAKTGASQLSGNGAH